MNNTPVPKSSGTSWPGSYVLSRKVRDAAIGKEDGQLLRSEADILRAILERQGKNGEPCCVTLETLANDAKMSRRTAIRAVNALKRRGLIHVQRWRLSEASVACAPSKYAVKVDEVMKLPARGKRVVSSPVVDGAPTPQRPPRPRLVSTPPAPPASQSQPVAVEPYDPEQARRGATQVLATLKAVMDSPPQRIPRPVLAARVGGGSTGTE